MEPIIIYENKKQALKYMKYWQRILNLDSWLIDVRLHYDQPCIAPSWGASKIYRAIHIGVINIPMPKPNQINTFPQRYSQELITVHELCHFRIPSVQMEVENTANDFYEDEVHASLEAVAKGYIMAKYELTMQYFENFN